MSVLFLFGFIGIDLFSEAKQPNALDPSVTYPLRLLWKSYHDQDFSQIIPYTTGKFKDQIVASRKTKDASKNALLSNYLDKFEVFASASQKAQTVLAVHWIFKYPSTPQHPNSYYKLVNMEYHLIFQELRWKISDSKYLGESYMAFR